MIEGVEALLDLGGIDADKGAGPRLGRFFDDGRSAPELDAQTEADRDALDAKARDVAYRGRR